MRHATTASKSRRMIVNTVLIYLKSVISVILLLFSSRIVFKSLGVSDFGIYNLLGGTIALCGFLNASISVSTQRFLSFEMGRENGVALNETFNTSVVIHGSIALLVIIIAETFGIYLLVHLAIPAERHNAALWSFQALIVNLAASLIMGPFQALMNAHEDMHILVGFELGDLLLRVGAALVLSYLPYDRLITYSILIVIISLVGLMVNILICKARYKLSGIGKKADRTTMYKMLGFSGWNVLGALAMLGKNQGLAIILNLFHGVVINAAYAIANQVGGQLMTFSQSVVRAANPQITKNYSAGNMKEMFALTYGCSKLAFWLLFIMSVPLLFETRFVLKTWLGAIPENAIIFCQLLIINSLVEVVSFPLMTVVQATGRIKHYQVAISSVLLSIVPISYFMLKANFPPAGILGGMIVVSVIALMVRLEFTRHLTGLTKRLWFSKVFLKVAPVVVLTLLVAFAVRAKMEYGFYRFIAISMVAVTVGVSSIVTTGLEASERNFIVTRIKLWLNPQC